MSCFAFRMLSLMGHDAYSYVAPDNGLKLKNIDGINKWFIIMNYIIKHTDADTQALPYALRQLLKRINYAYHRQALPIH